MFEVTDAALREIAKTLAEHPEEAACHPFIRLDMGVGWMGPTFKMALDESKKKNDKLIEAGGRQFLIRPSKWKYFQDARLDFTRTLFGTGEFQLVQDAAECAIPGPCSNK